MKKYIYLAASLAAAALCGCNKQNPVQTLMPEPDGCAQIALSLAGSRSTKASVDGTDVENEVGTVDVFVFFKGGEFDGRLDAYEHFDTAPYTLSATAGDRTIYAVVNSEHSKSVLETISTQTELLSKMATLSSQKNASNKPGLFTMIGSVNRTEATSNALVAGVNSVTVTVDRMVSRVRLQKITRAFESSALASQDFRVDEVYLANAESVDEYGPGHTPAADEFVNKLGVPDESYDIWLRRALSSTLANNESKTLTDASYSLYAMPNPVDTDSEATPFTVRNTKLVVKAALAGKALYYVIPLGAIRGNTTYDISELVLTRPGSSDPEQKTEVASCTFTLEISPWTVVPVETETGRYVI